MSGDEEPCRLGYEEYDGSRYCFAHAGFTIAGSRSMLCDRYASPRNMEEMFARVTADRDCPHEPPHTYAERCPVTSDDAKVQP